ncbi:MULTISPECIES: hypothetical protein [unclassified Clostridium]|uniref:hypothetical protein n=1 Tax=unclassified Clostridium TaxID=2614128 RepID=UPI0025B7B74C|nr:MULTISPECIES: hypothetical protein [unclassified Clostridium]
MKVLFDEEYLELKMIVHKKEDIKIIKDAIYKYPVTWNTIRRMLLCGLEASQIKNLCGKWYKGGYIISDMWDIIESCIQQFKVDKQTAINEINELLEIHQKRGGAVYGNKNKRYKEFNKTI